MDFQASMEAADRDDVYGHPRAPKISNLCMRGCPYCRFAHLRSQHEGWVNELSHNGTVLAALDGGICGFAKNKLLNGISAC